MCFPLNQAAPKKGKKSKNPQAKIPKQWAAVNTALIKSVRTGVFFDRKYWARHSNSGDGLKPVYLSSKIMNDKAQQLKECASKSRYRCG